LTAAISAAAGLIIAFLGAGMLGRPLHQLAERARQIGRGDLAGRINLRRSDELGELAESMNDMCEQLQKARRDIRVETNARIVAVEKLRHQDRLRTVGRLASGLAHELGTPLNVISGRASMILSGNLTETERLESARAIKAQTRQMTEIVRHLLEFARRRHPVKARIDVGKVITQTVNLLRPLAEKEAVEIDTGLPEEEMKTEVDFGQIQQVVTNMVMNSIQAMPSGGKVRIDLERVIASHPEKIDAGAEWFRIRVVDEGIGIAEADLLHLFEPFFTTKKAGKGTGLGLSIAYGIIEEHGGWINVRSQPGQGAEFMVYLPIGD